MAAIVYLDADDEITSAASRIRTAGEPRVGLVVPYGSRLATSRINFRLLAREAQSRGRRLSIVAGDAATRALAASAGLPIFSSVAEFEQAEATAPAVANGRRKKGSVPAVVATPAEGTGSPSPALAAGDTATDTAAKGTPADLEATAALPAVAATAVTGAAAGGSRAKPTSAPVGPGSSAESTQRSTTSVPIARSRPRFVLPFGRNVGIVLVAVLALALLASGVGAYLLLPSADITIATRTEQIGPVPLEIRADPAVTEPDPATATVPAQRLEFDVAASAVFPSTGQRVEANAATGRVTFRSKDPISENTIGSGAVVSTPNGIRFRTTGGVTIPKATIVGLTIVPGEASVGIEAAETGTRGNVEPNSITVIPNGEDPTFTEVRNPQATSGGFRREFPRVVQADIDAALAQLRIRLDEEFALILADPGRIPEDLTLFPDTRHLLEPLPTTDPATLLNQEVAEFTLGLAATGTAVAVDETPVEIIARTRIAEAVDPGFRLVDDSTEYVAGDPIVEGETVTFPVSASAEQIRVLDVAALRAEIKGKTIAQARAILEPYGTVTVRVWPEWVTAIPTLDGRVTLKVEAPAGPGPRSSPSPRPSAPGSPSPSGASPATGAPPAASASPAAS